VGKFRTLVGQFFSTGGANAPPVKQLKNALITEFAKKERGRIAEKSIKAFCRRKL